MFLFFLVSGVFIAMFMGVMLTSKQANAAGVNHYKFGVFPFMPMAALVKYFNAVGADLTRRVNKRVIAQSRPTFKQFTEEIENETYDILFIQPFDYPLAYKHNYRPLARRIDDLTAVLVTKKDSEVSSLSGLVGKVLALPPFESAVTHVMKNEFRVAGIDPNEGLRMVFTGNHFACIQMVLVREADACATAIPVLNHWENTRWKKQKLRVIHTAKPVPNTVYMAHARVSKTDQEKIKTAIVSWDKRPEGRSILKIFSLTSFVEAIDSDYDVIRSFQLGK